jgi:hypothetical protein
MPYIKKGYKRTPEYLEKQRISQTGKKRSQEVCEINRKAQNRPEVIEKKRKKLIGRFSGSKHPMFGKHQTSESNKKNSESNKKYWEIHDSFWKGKHLSKETKIKISKSHTGKTLSEEHVKNMRLSLIKRLEKHDMCYPNYNLNACEYFKKFDEEHNTKGRYAVYGGGEYKIKELGYFVDYINFDLKLIMEWDETAHYDMDDKLMEKDRIRQEQIQRFFSDFKFKRIKECKKHE